MLFTNSHQFSLFLISFYMTKWKNFANWCTDTQDITFGNMVEIWLTLRSIAPFENLQIILLLTIFYQLAYFLGRFVFNESILDVNKTVESFNVLLVWVLTCCKLFYCEKVQFQKRFFISDFFLRYKNTNQWYDSKDHTRSKISLLFHRIFLLNFLWYFEFLRIHLFILF